MREFNRSMVSAGRRRLSRASARKCPRHPIQRLINDAASATSEMQSVVMLSDVQFDTGMPPTYHSPPLETKLRIPSESQPRTVRLQEGRTRGPSQVSKDRLPHGARRNRALRP